jgi:hypothetical protein
MIDPNRDLDLERTVGVSPERGRRKLLAAMYNTVVVAVLAHAALGLGATGVLLWPAVGLHTALAAWCIACPRAYGASFW